MLYELSSIPCSVVGRAAFLLRKSACIICTAACAVFFISCSSGGGQSRTRAFPQVRMPEIFADDAESGMSYIAEHYWDGLADTTGDYLCDSAHVAGVKTEEVERQFRMYAELLDGLDLRDARTALRKMYGVSALCESSDTSSNVFETLMDLSDRYLYDVNSPLRDEDIYGAYASCLAHHAGFSPEKQSIYEYRAGLCSMNERGTPAADFEFRDAKGVTRTLYDVKADYILLFFSNPGCHACKEIIESLSDPALGMDALIAEGRLAVLNIYIDEDLQAWYDYMPIYPKTWCNAYDPNYVIRGETLYNVRAIPSLYLLDGDKTVLLKDAPLERIFYAIAQIADSH